MDKQPAAETTARSLPLRFAQPEAYGMLMKELEAIHLHPFDVHASAIAAGDEWTIEVRYGDGAVSQSRSFRFEEPGGASEEFAAFCRNIAIDCKKTLIADYFKMMKA